MSVIAEITPRAASWDLPLFVHILGAMILVAGLVTGASALAFAKGDPKMLRLGFWALMLVSFPGWIIMRLGAEWVASKGWNDVSDKPTWLDLGMIIADVGGLILVITLILGGIGVRRVDRGQSAGLLKAVLVLSLLLLAAYVVAVWAMAGKPG
jgi:hypothetical protein